MRSTVVALFVAGVMAGCSKGAPGASPETVAQAAGATGQAQQAQAPPQPEAVKPMPAQLPDVLARVNGETVSKADFERAIQSIEQRAGGPVPPDQRDRVLRGLLDQLVGLKLLAQEAKAQKVTVADADVTARIDAIKQQFPSEDVFKQMLVQQKMTIEALRADQQQDLAISKLIEKAIASKVAVTPDQVSAFYKENPDRFKQGERVRASHILFAFPQNADAATKEKVRAKAEGVLKEVKAGKDFAALAKEHSEDPGSAVNGGDLGYFPQGQMVGPFNDAAFSLAAGAVSNLVETQFGYHIIKVVDKQAARTVPLDEVRAQVQQYLENVNKQRETNSFVEGLKAKGKVEILV